MLILAHSNHIIDGSDVLTVLDDYKKVEEAEGDRNVIVTKFRWNRI